MRLLPRCLPMLLLALPATAQNETADIAHCLVRALAPAADDVDASVRDLIATAADHERSPLAWLLIEEATYRLGQMQDLATVQKSLPQPDPTHRHGLLEQKLDELRWYLDGALRSPALAGDPPACGYARQCLSVGPLGDAGDDFVGVVLPPELAFPRLGSELPGRGATARVRVVPKALHSVFLQLSAESRPLPGCYYALLHCETKAAVEAYLELDYTGDSQVFVDDQEVMRVERWRHGNLRRQYAAMSLPTGVHTVLVKTCTADNQHIAVRWLDSEGRAQPGVQWLPPEQEVAAEGPPATPSNSKFLAAGDLLAAAAQRPDAEPCVVIAALWCAVNDNARDLAIDLAERLRKSPPQDPTEALAWARLVRRVEMPDELRKAESRAAVERVADKLPKQHFAAALARIELLDEQEQREQALRLCAELPPGPETFSRRLELLRKLHFTAEIVPLLHQWMQACPLDSRPPAQIAYELRDTGDSRSMLDLRLQSLHRRHDQSGLASSALRNALDLGDFDTAVKLLDEMLPTLEVRPTTSRLRWEIEIALARHEDHHTGELLDRLLADPDADIDGLRDAATSWLHLASRASAAADCKAKAVRCLERALEIDADQPAIKQWLTALDARPSEDADFVPFRHDGDAAIHEFVAGEREAGASMTIVLDQRILVMQKDGSWTLEGHQVRRINDQTGVDAFRENNGLGQIEEVLLVRTHAPDGNVYVPARIDNNYAMQRLEPGSFVEWRYRQRQGAPGAGPVSTAPFVFGSADEPTVLSELVLVVPPGSRGELRVRGLAEASEQRTLDDGRRVLIFTRRDVPALPKERFLPALMELRASVEMGEDGDPFPQLRDGKIELGKRAAVTAPIQAVADPLFAGIDGDAARTKAAWDYCQREIEDGRAATALETLLRKKGSRVLLCIALLRAGGVHVLPMACSDSRPELGGGLTSLFPPPEGIEAPGAVVPLADGSRIHLFADVPRHWPLGAVPATRAGTEAYVVDGDRIDTIVLPSTDNAVQTLRVEGTARIDGDNIVLEVNAELGDVQGFALAQRVRELKENVQKLAARQVSQQLFPGWRVDTARMADVAPGKPLRIEATLKRSGVQASGDGFVAALPLPPSRLVTSYGDRKERTLPYRVRTDERTEWQIDFLPGPDLRIVKAPDPMAVDNGPLHYDFTIARHENGLRLRRSVRMHPTLLPAADFFGWLRTMAAVDHSEQATIELAPRTRKP